MKKIVLLFTALLCCASMKAAEPESATSHFVLQEVNSVSSGYVRGYVFTSSGRAAQGCVVTILVGYASTSPTAVAYTDVKGYFSFTIGLNGSIMPSYILAVNGVLINSLIYSLEGALNDDLYTIILKLKNSGDEA